jgi:hypothetical protein
VGGYGDATTAARYLSAIEQSESNRGVALLRSSDPLNSLNDGEPTPYEMVDTPRSAHAVVSGLRFCTNNEVSEEVEEY